MAQNKAAMDWMMSSDPSIRWQVMRDLLDAPESEWQPERSKVEHEGWGKRLLSHQDEDGQWAGGCFVPADITAEEFRTKQPWTATNWCLSQLREFGLDPTSQRAKETVKLVGKNSRWDEGGQPFWEGETEECINGRAVATGAYFGVDMSALVKRLLGERQEDGGWNCERASGSVRSSFHTTINILEGLLAYEKAHGASPETAAARQSGEEYLLRRHLFLRLTTGEVIDEKFLQFIHPYRWYYNVLRALEYFRDAALFTGSAPDPRLEEAISHVRSKRLEDGKWALDEDLPGRDWFKMNDGPGSPSPWITLNAMRVLRWWDESKTA